MTIFGWDQSHFDAPGIGSAVAEGISFITHKAGGDATDGELPAWWAGVRALDPARVLLGAYWVLRPPVDAADEAGAFLRRLDAACPGWRDRPFLLQLDCEKWNGDASTVPSKAQIAAVCAQLVKAMPKLRPVVYAPKWVYGDTLKGLGYPLWASAYVTGSGGFKALYPGDSSSRWAAYSGQTPAILQYSSSATIGGQTTSDANAFRGTLAQLVQLVAPGWSDDVTKQDVLDALGEFFAMAPSNNADKMPESVIGDRAWKQPIPNPFQAGKRTTAWQMFADLSATVGAFTSATPSELADVIVKALPADLAKQLADELAQRLSA